MLTPSAPAPEDYYQNNCCHLFGYVLGRYETLLSAAESQQLRTYLGLGNDAQRLLARLLTRKGPIFRLDKLDYREIADLPAAAAELNNAEMLALQPLHPGDLYLGLLRKDELVQLLKEREIEAKGISSWKKNELTAWFLGRYTDEQLRCLSSSVSKVVGLQNAYVWDLAKLLFFGETHSDWSTFVLNDLGLVQYEAVTALTNQYSDRQTLEQDLEMRRISRMSHMLDDFPELESVLTLKLLSASGDRFFMRRRDRTLMRIAGHLESNNKISRACEIYQHVERHPARERTVRLLTRQGHKAAANQLLETARTQPYSEEEAQFCERFGQRNKGFQPETFEVTIDAVSPNTRIEEQALKYLAAAGGMSFGIHAENTFIRSMTGIIYWSALFAGLPGAFTNPYQAGPNDLYLDDFYSVRESTILALEADLADDQAMRGHIEHILTEKYLVANSLVSWSLFEHVSVEKLFTHIPIGDIRRLAAFLIRRLAQFRTGQPDLLVFHEEGGYELIEVKGPGDQLQPTQRLWFKHFAEMAIPARVMKIKKA
ncbi:MAG: hypothetical protein GKR90_05255 [Pseudomonadales bacterium]|nr:hypothetical protein [Pseudomonadales bacterium]